MKTLEDPDFKALLTCLLERTGLAYYIGKETELARKLHKRMRHLNLESFQEYLALLRDDRHGPAEWDELIAEVTVGETFFFRHLEQFAALRTRVLPDILERNHTIRRLRIWSAGCSIGAEPYSLAIMLSQDFGLALAGWRVDIVATDLNPRALAIAREGRYNEWALRASSPEFRQTYFQAEDRAWVLRNPWRQAVEFHEQNLVLEPACPHAARLGGFDLVLCRNVMMYFSRPTMRRLAQGIHESMADGGWLLVGPSENDSELFRGFTPQHVPDATLYHKAPAAVEIPLPRLELPSLPAPDPVPDLRQLADAGRWDQVLQICDRRLRHDALDPTTHYFRALVFKNMDDEPNAENALRKTLYLDRNHSMAHYHLGLLLHRQGDRNGARKAFLNLLRTLPQTPEVPHSDGRSPAEVRQAVEAEILKLQSPELPC